MNVSDLAVLMIAFPIIFLSFAFAIQEVFVRLTGYDRFGNKREKKWPHRLIRANPWNELDNVTDMDEWLRQRRRA